MILYIIRHAWAVDPDDPRWPDDRDRPLTDEGRARWAAMVKSLADRGFAPQLIATSPLVRCRETSQILAAGVSGKPKTVLLDALAPESDLGQLIAWTNREAGRCRELAWVGHAPDVSHLAAALIGDSRSLVHFSKGAVAAIEFDGPVQPSSGELRWLVTAKVLGC